MLGRNDLLHSSTVWVVWKVGSLEYGMKCLIDACFEVVQDRVTRTLQNLLTEINRIHRTRGGKAMQRAQRDESKALQILTAEYLREKGAPKVCALSFATYSGRRCLLYKFRGC